MKCPHCEEELTYVTRAIAEYTYGTETFTISDITVGTKLPDVDLNDEATLALVATMEPPKRTITADWGETDYGDDYGDTEYPDGPYAFRCPHCDRGVYDALEKALDHIGSAIEYDLEEDEAEEEDAA